MTEPIEPPPTSPAPLPLSVVLLGHSGATELEDSLRAWIEFLRGINRSFEVILSADAGLAFRENEPERNRLPDGRVVIPPDQYEILGRIMELKQFPEVKTVVPPPGQVWGLGAALRTGLAEAKHPLIFFTLADKQYQPGDLPSFLEEINQVHLVSGFRLGGRIPWWLNLGGFFYRLFCQVVFGLPVEGRLCWLGWSGLPRRLLARWLFGIRFHDPECVYCLCRREVLGRIPIQSQGSFALLEFLAKANFTVPSGAELSVKSTPMPTQPRVEGDSFFREAWQVFRHPDFGPPVLEQPQPSCK